VLQPAVSAGPLWHSGWPQLDPTQTFAEEQDRPDGQVPQDSVPPQPSGIVPQVFPCAAQVVGVQPPPPQVAPHRVFASFTQTASQETLQQYGSFPQTVPAQVLQVAVSAEPLTHSE
jgi:hypothetical protein